MTASESLLQNPQILAAIEEIKSIISRAHPEAEYETYLDLEGESVWLRAVVDVEDTDDVVDLFIGRLLDIHDEIGVRLHVLPVQTPERAERAFHAYKEATAQHMRAVGG